MNSGVDMHIHHAVHAQNKTTELLEREAANFFQNAARQIQW